MNTFTKAIFSGALFTALTLATAGAQGFTDSDVVFYGEIRQVGGAGTVLLQSGRLEVTFANQNNAANRVTLTANLQPTGTGATRPYSYAIKVPLAYLPEAPRIGEFLAIGSSNTDFKIEQITVNGNPATLPDGSKEFYGLSFASRADQYRLDLLVIGDSTDTDGDGLPDWWETLNGLDPNLADANGDLDGDGWSNLDEFLRGSDPTKSNTEPELATAELLVPEQGQAGCYLQFHDSDTAPADILIEADPSELLGFELRWSGTAVSAANMPSLNLAAVQSGRLTITHADPAIREASLPLTWSDGGETHSGSIRLRVTSPTTTDGNDASLWLEASSLPAGESLATWPDRSGNHRDAMQPLEDYQPTVVNAGGQRSVRFPEATSHLFFQDAAIPAGNHTVLAAWQSDRTSADQQFLLSSNRGFLRLDATSQAVSYPGAPFYQADGAAVRGYESTLGADVTSIFRRDGEVLQNVFGLSYNGEAIAPEALDPVLPTLGARRLALPVEEPITNHFKGLLHELLVFPSALPEQKLRDVHDYLNSKWSGYITWDFSEELRPIDLAATGTGLHIIRGGHGDDDLRGGDRSNILSGGPGNDTLRGGPGVDTFVFGGVDSGKDVLIDFDSETDVIDLSALFWGQSGDARQFLSTRLDTNFETAVPTLDTVLIVQRPDASTQEIVLRDTVLGAPQIVELIVEGRLRMGGLSIPTTVDLALAAGSEDTAALRESLEDSFTIELTRSGDGVPAALEVPLGLFQDALGRDLVLEGSESVDGQRAVVKFERGQTTKQVTFRPVPDLETEGAERWEAAVLPHFRYDSASGPVARTVTDDAMLWLSVAEANALTSGQAARVRIHRDGATTSALDVTIELDGTAQEGVHLNSVPRSITIPAGQPFAEVAITTADGWDGAMTRMAMLRLVSQDGYLVGHPHEATIYAGQTAPDPDEAGFDRWLTATSEGRFSSYLDLLQAEGARAGDYLRAYAFGQSVDSNASGISFRLLANRPELSARLSSSSADLRWQVQSSADAQEWSDVSATFSENLSADGLRLLGAPRQAGDEQKLYRLSFALETGSNLEAGLARLASSDRYGVSGTASWQADPLTGQLASTADTPGAVSRIIVEIDSPTLLDFTMAVRDGDGSDSLAFYIDGERVAQTSGAAIHIHRKLNPAEPALLMWEFRRSTGTALIGNGPKALAPGKE